MASWLGSAQSAWSLSPAESDLNMSNYNINNVNGISTVHLEVGSGEINIQDSVNSSNNVLLATDGDLYFNDQLLARAGDIQNINQWALYSAVDNLQCDGFSISNVGTYSGSNVRVSSISTVNASISSLNCLTSHTRTANVSTFNVSSIVGNRFTFGTGTVSNLTTTQTNINGGLLTTAGGVLNFNGSPITTGSGGNASNWSAYKAQNPVNMGSNRIYSTDTTLVVGSNNYPTSIIGNLIGITSEANIRLSNDSGVSINPGLISLYTQGGNYGKVDIIADSGSGDLLGGLVNIQALSGSSYVGGLSRVNVEGATVVVSAGAIGSGVVAVPSAVNITSVLGGGIYAATTLGPIAMASGTYVSILGGLGLRLDDGGNGINFTQSVLSNAKSITTSTITVTSNINLGSTNQDTSINFNTSGNSFITSDSNMFLVPDGKLTLNSGTCNIDLCNARLFNVSTIESGLGGYIGVNGYLNFTNNYGINSVGFPLRVSTQSMIVNGQIIAGPVGFLTTGPVTAGTSINFTNGNKIVLFHSNFCFVIFICFPCLFVYLFVRSFVR
jgi:hypothetical protein